MWVSSRDPQLKGQSVATENVSVLPPVRKLEAATSSCVAVHTLGCIGPPTPVRPGSQLQLAREYDAHQPRTALLTGHNIMVTRLRRSLEGIAQYVGPVPPCLFR